MPGELSLNEDRMPQFSMRWLLLVTTGAVSYVAVTLAIVVGAGWPLIERVMDEPAFLAIGCAIAVLTGFCLMVVNVALGRRGYLWPTVLLLVAILFALANAVAFVGTLVIDAFIIFDPPYMVAAVVGGPAVMLLTLVIVTGFVRHLDWPGIVGYFLWIAGAGFAHLWIIAAAASSI